MANPGFYKDPHDPNFQRYWDGQQWGTETRPVAPPSVANSTQTEQRLQFSQGLQESTESNWYGLAVLAVPPPADPPALHAAYGSAVHLRLSRSTFRRIRKQLVECNESVGFDIKLAGYVSLRILSSAKEAIYESGIVRRASGDIDALAALTTRVLADVYQVPVSNVSQAVEDAIRALGTGDFTRYLTSCYPRLDLEVTTREQLVELNEASQAALTTRTSLQVDEFERTLKIQSGQLTQFLQTVR